MEITFKITLKSKIKYKYIYTYNIQDVLSVGLQMIGGCMRYIDIIKATMF